MWTLHEIWRYPVKSMAGESLSEVAVGVEGVSSDRGLAVIDVSSGAVGTAKYPSRWAWLLRCRARLDDARGDVVVRLPEGAELAVHGCGLDAALSAVAGRAVRVARCADTTQSIQRTDPDLAVLEQSGELALGAPAPGALGGAAPGTLFDYAPIHLITRATIAAVAANDVHAARFRPNLVLDGGRDDAPYRENAWIGRQLRVGDSLVLDVVAPTPRCVVPTLAQPGLQHDPGVLRALIRDNRAPFQGSRPKPCAGVYALVRVRGRIRVGDRCAPDA